VKRARLLLLPALLAVATPTHGRIAGSFIIFFDSGSDRLDEPTRGILDNVAAAIDAIHPVAIVIAGHADRAGEPGPNMRLSCRRARAARDYLATRGVAPERVAIEGYGEERRLVETDDGVAEPQNRRVEFTLSPSAPYAPTRNC
jgi:outer membrane protein OmpA-like peptidoglycan-associated protein